jgi:pimeloyl-ACP methyl ester carboxylesterase
MDALARLALPESRWIDVNGPVHYRLWDRPTGGPTFVCVHGLGGSLLNWALVAPGLAQRGPVFALDLAGFGLTPLGERGAGVGSNFKVLDGFLRALGLRAVVLIGNSMGGMVSMIQAAQRPESVESLVLVDAAFPRTRTVRGQFDPRVASLFALYSAGRVGEWFARMRSRRLGAEGLVRETLRVTAADPATIDPALVEAMIEQTEARQEFDYATRAFLAAARSIFRAQWPPLARRWRSIPTGDSSCSRISAISRRWKRPNDGCRKWSAGLMTRAKRNAPGPAEPISRPPCAARPAIPPWPRPGIRCRAACPSRP